MKRKNGERLAKRGITKEFIKEMNANMETVQKAGSEQEALKARLNEKTTEFEAVMAKLADQSRRPGNSSNWNAAGVLERVRDHGAEVNEERLPNRDG